MLDDTKLTIEERAHIYQNLCFKCKFEAACSYVRKREKTPLDCSIAQKYYKVFACNTS
jgi:hypothetical protein